jgi:hypothetical protein
MRAHLTQRPHGPLIGRLLAGAALLLLPVASAEASNNFTLQRFGTCERLGSTGNCLQTSRNEKAFRSFAGQLGEVMTIKGVAPADTPGVAGFVFQIDRSFNDFDVKTDGAENPWVLAHKTGKPEASMGTTQIHVRKGLPFSFEVGTVLTLLDDSDLLAVGVEGKWALHEDIFWPLPDLAIHGGVNTLLGSPDLVLTNLQIDALTSLPIGISSVVNLTPFGGYGVVLPFSASRLIDTTPGDARPAVASDSEALRNQPEVNFSLDVEVRPVAVVGARFQWAMLDLTYQSQFSGAVTSQSLSIGADF